ncbi:alcohol dehydrogenase catalytic domain-containing protein [Lacticaseibacillus sp. GG6-2]
MPTNLAFAAYEGLPISDPNCFTQVELPMPTPAANEIVVAIQALSLNPIDTKLRASLPKQTDPKIFGYDAVGRVEALGSAVTEFFVGQRVLYAGTTKKAGSYQHYQAVPANLVASAPAAAPAEELAALPLVGLTAWEVLFEKMGFIPHADANAGKTILVINGAGGVGSMLTQLAHWAGLTVIATASKDHFDWLKQHGTDVPLDYHDDWQQQIPRLVDGIAILYAPEPYLAAATQLIAPLGHVVTIVTPTQPLDLAALKPKSASFDQEYMFTKSDYGVAFKSTRAILDRIVTLYSGGKLDASVTAKADLTLANLVAATKALEAGHSVGKSVLLVKA